MTDRLEDIKEHIALSGADHEDAAWLVAEIERLRWFEERFNPYQFNTASLHYYCSVCTAQQPGAALEATEHAPGCEYVLHGGKK